MRIAWRNFTNTRTRRCCCTSPEHSSNVANSKSVNRCCWRYRQGKMSCGFHARNVKSGHHALVLEIRHVTWLPATQCWCSTWLWCFRDLPHLCWKMRRATWRRYLVPSKSLNWLTGSALPLSLIPWLSCIYSGKFTIPSNSSHRYFSYLSKAGDKMRFDLALAASEARSVVTSHCNTLSVFFCVF